MSIVNGIEKGHPQNDQPFARDRIGGTRQTVDQQRAQPFVPPSARASTPQRLRPESGIPPEYVALLKEAMQRRGWSRAELGRQIGASRSTVTKWLGGEGKPDKKHLPALSQVLGIPQVQLQRFYFDRPVDEFEDVRALLLSDVIAIPADISRQALQDALMELRLFFPVIVAAQERIHAAHLVRAAELKAELGALMAAQEGRRHATSPEAPPPPDATGQSLPLPLPEHPQ